MANQTFYANYPTSGAAGASNASVGANTAPAPTSSTEIGFIDGSGNLQGVSTTNPLPVDIHFDTVVVSENLAQVNGATVNVGIGTSGAGTQRVAVSSDSSLSITGNVTVVQPTGTNLHTTVDNFPATQAVTQSTSPWIVAGAGTAGTPGTAVLTVQGIAGGTAQPVSGTVAATQSGTWNITNISGTVSLPTGAATSANQTTLGSQTTKINDGTNTAAVKAASTAPLATDPALVVAISPNTPSLPITPLVNTNGSASNSTTVTNTVATTFSAPTNAVGFVVEAESSNTVNLRYACGTTATTSVGMLLEPGRDSGYIPSKGTVTVICATAATNQSAGIQWVLSS